MTRLDDPALVREQYADERGLRARAAIWRETTGPDVKEILWETIAGLEPRRLLEVGGGEGGLSERIARELAADVTLIDQSERMVELARARSIDARVADVQELPFEDGCFDAVVAAWMLYHVADLDRGLGEIVRVLRPGGALVAVTNSHHHAEELFELIGYPWRAREGMFSAENGEERLRDHFASVSRRDVVAWATVRDRRTLDDYRDSMMVETMPVPDDLELPFRIGARTVVFVATP